MKKHILLFCICTLLLSAFITLKAQTVNPNYRDGMLSVRLNENTLLGPVESDSTGVVDLQSIPSAMVKIIKKYQLRYVEHPFRDHRDGMEFVVYVWFNDIYAIDELKDKLTKLSCVKYVAKDARCFLHGLPDSTAKNFNDPLSNLAKACGGDCNLELGWHLNLIHADAALGLGQSKSSVKVAVIDDAIWGEHPDLQIPTSQQYNAYTQTVGNSAPPSYIMDYKDSLCSDEDIENDDCELSDWSHGTHVAGLVAAINNNNIGVASLGSGASLYGVRVADNNENMYNTNIRKGIDWACKQGCTIVTMSLGSPNYDQISQDLINSWYNKGVCFIASAGNNDTTEKNYPAAYNHVISVASVNADTYLSNFSNYGSWVDIAAPGGFRRMNPDDVDPRLSVNATYSLVSTTSCTSQDARYMGFSIVADAGYYDFMQGTSMATPVVTSLVTLLRSQDETLTPDDIAEIIIETAQTIDPDSTGRKYIATNSMIDAEAAMQYIQIPQADFAADTAIGPASLTIHFTNKTVSKAPATYSWSFPGGIPSTSTEENPTVVYANPGAYTVSLTVTNRNGSNNISRDDYITVVNTEGEDYFYLIEDSVIMSGLNNSYLRVQVHSNIENWSAHYSGDWLSAFRDTINDIPYVGLKTLFSNATQVPRSTIIYFTDPDRTKIFDSLKVIQDVYFVDESTCANRNNWTNEDKSIIYTIDDHWGTLTGHNEFGWYEYVEKFTNDGKLSIDTAWFGVRYAKAVSNDAHVTIKIYNEEDNQPGKLLTYANIPITSFVEQSMNGLEFFHTEVEGNFYIGCQVYYNEEKQDTFALYSSTINRTVAGSAYFRDANGWHAFDTLSRFDAYLPISLCISIKMCGVVEDMSFKVQPSQVYLSSTLPDSTVLHITSENDWTIQTDGSSWFNVTPHSGTGCEQVTVYAVEENTQTTSRSGRLLVAENGASSTIEVTQLGAADKIEVSTDSLDVPNEAYKALSFNVNANIDWIISGNAETHYSISPKNGTVGSKRVTVRSRSQNATRNVILDTLFVSGNDIAVPVYITQRCDTLEPSAKELLFIHEIGDNQTFTLTSTTNWTIKGGENHYAVFPLSGKAGIHEISVSTLVENTEANRRTDTLLLSGTLLKDTILLTQKGDPAGINIVASEQLTAYPNPADKQLQVVLPNTYTALSITNSLGQEVFSSSVQHQTQINTAEWANGVYLLHATTPDGKIVSQKFIVKHQ